MTRRAWPGRQDVRTRVAVGQATAPVQVSRGQTSGRGRNPRVLQGGLTPALRLAPKGGRGSCCRSAGSDPGDGPSSGQLLPKRGSGPWGDPRSGVHIKGSDPFICSAGARVRTLGRVPAGPSAARAERRRAAGTCIADCRFGDRCLSWCWVRTLAQGSDLLAVARGFVPRPEVCPRDTCSTRGGLAALHVGSNVLGGYPARTLTRLLASPGLPRTLRDLSVQRSQDQVHDQLRVPAQALGLCGRGGWISTSLARSRRRSLPSRRSCSSTPPMRPWNVV